MRLPPPDDYGPFHGFDAVVPASPRPYVVCVTAVNIGAGTDTRVCRDIDYITRFAGTRITYDTSGAEIAESDVETLDQVTHTNDTAVQQSTTVAGSEEVTETRRWRLPDLLEGASRARSASPSSTAAASRCAAIRLRRLEDDDVVAHVLLGQPVLLPPRSRVVATITAARTQLIVPYTLLGEFVYSSGARASGAIDGVYTGVNGHDLTVALRQYNPDGTLRLVEPGTGVHG